MLCPKCGFECRNIFKKAFKNKYGEFVSIGKVKTRKERSLIWNNEYVVSTRKLINKKLF